MRILWNSLPLHPSIWHAVDQLDVAVPCSSPWGTPQPLVLRGGSITDEGGRAQPPAFIIVGLGGISCLEMPPAGGGGRFWRCRNQHVVKGWAKGWNLVESEFNVKVVPIYLRSLWFFHESSLTRSGLAGSRPTRYCAGLSGLEPRGVQREEDGGR